MDNVRTCTSVYSITGEDNMIEYLEEVSIASLHMLKGMQSLYNLPYKDKCLSFNQKFIILC